MLQRPTIPNSYPAEPARNQQALYALGLDHVRALSRRIWTDHNLHDPGITILELLSYALTELSYRASWPIEDLLASATGSSAPDTLFTARDILTNGALTVSDYRKLLIDIPQVQNAWLQPVTQLLHADPVTGALTLGESVHPGGRQVHVRGLYKVRLDVSDPISEQDYVLMLEEVNKRLAAQRNLCEDFLPPDVVGKQDFIVCTELLVTPNADLARVHAEVYVRIENYLAPPVLNYSLAEMLTREQADGTLYTLADVFRGPKLQHGFIDDQELERADLRTEILLSDVISLIMDIEGVLAVKDILISRDGSDIPMADKWRVKVNPGMRPRLVREHSHILTRKRDLPVWPDANKVELAYSALKAAEPQKRGHAASELDQPVPQGKARKLTGYHSFQHDFPALYGLSDAGLPEQVGDARRALALQLKAYLLFFDQIMADYCAQLGHVRDLFSLGALTHTYFGQNVSFAEVEKIYDAGAADDVRGELETSDQTAARVNRFLDHLIARFAERFHDYVAVSESLPYPMEQSPEEVKREFLKTYPQTSSSRGLGYNQKSAQVWNTPEVSGLEQRVARLLGIKDASRRDLAGAQDGEGMLLIENILLRMPNFADPRPDVCATPDCGECLDDDPYSYRVHVILPAHAGRFKDMTFRDFAEEVIRQEMPAHVLPRVCWVSQEQMQDIQSAYRAWLEARTGIGSADLATCLKTLLEALAAARSVYPSALLSDCTGEEEEVHFVLGRTRIAGDDEST